MLEIEPPTVPEKSRMASGQCVKLIFDVIEVQCKKFSDNNNELCHGR
jgi:hypothetical protein